MVSPDRKLVVKTMRKHLDIPEKVLIDGKYYRLFDMWNSRSQAIVYADKMRKKGWIVRMKLRVRKGEAKVWILYRRRK